MTMKTMIRIIQLSVLTVAALSMSTAMACTTGAWSAVAGTTALDGDPATALPRVSGKCAMTLTEAGSVQDNSPVAEDMAFVRFYVLATVTSGTPTIFEAFSDEAATLPNRLISITTDGTDFVFDAGDGASPNVPGKLGWNLVEVAWDVSGVTKKMDYWVNKDATTDAADGSVSALDGTMESVILGSQAPLSGTLVFDEYEAHRETAIGPSDICNADGQGAIDLLDALEVVDEYFASPQAPDLAIGLPDCDLSGTVDLLDALEIVDLYFGT